MIRGPFSSQLNQTSAVPFEAREGLVVANLTSWIPVSGASECQQSSRGRTIAGIQKNANMVRFIRLTAVPKDCREIFKLSIDAINPLFYQVATYHISLPQSDQ